MTCAFEQSKGNLIACGGLDNVCSIYNVEQQSSNARAAKELVAHDGYLSCCRFVDEGHVLTASGDSSCIYWDVSSGDVLKTFTDHTGDVMSLAICPENSNIFVSGSVDTTAKFGTFGLEDVSRPTLDTNRISTRSPSSPAGTLWALDRMTPPADCLT